MKKLKIKNTTGKTNDTKISIGDIPLKVVTEVYIYPLKLNNTIKANITLDLSLIDLETDDFMIDLIYKDKETCIPNCKGCESGTPSIQGCR